MPEYSPILDFLERLYGDKGALEITDSTLDDFLIETSAMSQSPSERLRRLAIELELETFTDGWDSLHLIYERAIAEDPENIDCYHSYAISAMEWFEQRRTPEMEDRVRVAQLAETKIQQAIARSPEDAELSYLYGRILYNHPTRIGNRNSPHTGQALAKFDEALEKDEDYQMAALYRAHCFHDWQHWAKAFEAYAQVDPAQLLQQNPNWKWRVLKLREQMALCCAAAGNTEQGLQLLSSLFDELETLDPEEAIYDVVNLHNAVQFLTEVVVDEVLMERLNQIVKKFEMENWYRSELDIQS